MGKPLKFFATPPHSCSYLENKKATTLFADPHISYDKRLYSELTLNGFRRSGDYLYRPHCQHCSACQSLRIPVQHFSLSRSQKRIMARNRHLQVSEVAADFNPEHYALYERYINHRHADGDMYPPNPEQYTSFLLSQWSNTVFYEFRQDQTLVALAVVDKLDDGLSAIYTFFDPDYTQHSLGSYAILWQISHCQQHALSHVYLGYWIKSCQKMRYKANYSPAEIFVGDGWRPLPDHTEA